MKLTGTKEKYNVIVRTSPSQELRMLPMGFGTPNQRNKKPETIEYIKEVAEETCGTMFDELLERVEVIVDLIEQKVIYSVHKNKKKTINVLVKTMLPSAC